jgi:hypothetical protein
MWIVLSVLLCAGAIYVFTSRVVVSQANSLPSERPAAQNAQGVSGDAGIAAGVGEEIRPIQGAQVLTPTVYLPRIAMKYFKEFWYADDFSEPGSGWPWGNSPFDYGYKTDREDDTEEEVYHIRLEDEDDLAFVTGPKYAPGNFEYEALLRRASETHPLYWGDEYGILLSPHEIDTEAPFVASVYTFQIEYQIGGWVDSLYSITRWNGASKDDRNVLRRAGEGQYITTEPDVWNRLKITRTGDTLYFYLSCWDDDDDWKPWKYVYQYTDPGLPDYLYIGFYAYHSKDDLGGYTIEFQYDDVALHAHM